MALGSGPEKDWTITQDGHSRAPLLKPGTLSLHPYCELKMERLVVKDSHVSSSGQSLTERVLAKERQGVSRIALESGPLG